ncbi:MAG: hypothetical protein V1774_03190 [Candidatus Eisenbacteria bacterium]
MMSNKVGSVLVLGVLGISLMGLPHVASAGGGEVGAPIVPDGAWVSVNTVLPPIGLILVFDVAVLDGPPNATDDASGNGGVGVGPKPGPSGGSGSVKANEYDLPL